MTIWKEGKAASIRSTSCTLRAAMARRNGESPQRLGMEGLAPPMSRRRTTSEAHGEERREPHRREEEGRAPS